MEKHIIKSLFRFFFRTLTIMFLIIFMNGCNAPTHFTKDQPLREVITDQSIAQGKHLFQKHCARCHGETATGNGLEASQFRKSPANLIKQDVYISFINMALIVEAPYHSKLTMAWKIEDGKNEMPTWKEVLSHEEIDDITNFIKYLQFHANNPE